jgi:hypothetical protein
MRAHRGEQDQPWREDPVRLTLLTTPLVKGGRCTPPPGGHWPVDGGGSAAGGPLAPAPAGELRGGGPVALSGWSRRTWRRWVVGRLTGIDTMLLDLDGTLYVGSQVVRGTPEAVRWLRAQGLTVRFTTNTDSIPQPGSPTAWPGSASRPPRTSWSPDRDRRPAVRRRTGGAGAGRGADGVRELLASCRAGPGERATHVWSPIPATERPTTTWPPTSVVATRSARRRCWSAAARATAPSQAPGPSRTQWSTASPTCPDCSKPEYIRPAPQ